MSNYLDTYGVKEAKRERIVKRVVWTVLIVSVVSVSAYFFFRTYFEKQTMNEFLALLGQRNYQEAYKLWGCTEQTPCRDYAFQKFMEDWGPGSIWSDPHYAEIAQVRYCGDTVIFNLYIKGDDVNLVVNKQNQNIGFAPWPTCTGTIVQMEVEK